MQEVTPPAPSLHGAILDAGDRLVAALEEGDLEAAAHALDERDRLLGEAAGAELPPPPSALVERFRAQNDRLQRLLQGQLTSLSEALATASRSAVARGRYADGPRPSVVDTAPR